MNILRPDFLVEICVRARAPLSCLTRANAISSAQFPKGICTIKSGLGEKANNTTCVFHVESVEDILDFITDRIRGRNNVLATCLQDREKWRGTFLADVVLQAEGEFCDVLLWK